MFPNGLTTGAWKPLLICPNADLSQKLSAIWRAVAEAELMVELPRYLDRSALPSLIAGHAVTLCFVDVGSDRDLALSLIPGLKDLGVPVVALHTANDPDLILSCLRRGAAEFLYPPLSAEQLRAALDRIAKRAQTTFQGRGGGTIYGLMRGKSGCGNTTIACNLAFQLHALTLRRFCWPTWIRSRARSRSF